jgi:hypothetical protein
MYSKYSKDYEWVEASFSELKCETITSITGKVGDELMTFKCESGKEARLIYHNDCCAIASIEDICGDLQDLVNVPLLQAEEVSSKDNPEGVKIPEYQDSFTWTFYKLATIHGSVTIRWYGASNGYYSEQATFEWKK